MNNKQVLVEEKGIASFLIEFDPKCDYETSVQFKVLRVTSWEDTKTWTVRETEHYLSGYVKWDGCSHFNFGDANGYLHLCGKESYEGLKQVMDAIWDVCSKKIKRFDKTVAE